MVRTALRAPLAGWSYLIVIVATIVLPLGSVLPAAAHSQPNRAGRTTDLLVYHQLTDLVTSTGSVGFPVLSADGTTGVYIDAPGTGDAATPNRIFTIDIDSRAITEVDAYRSLCFCGAMVDISGDGATVVSSDSVQVRIADSGGARELVVLASNEISALVIAGNGETVFFLVRRDTATADGATTLPRGVWAIDPDGSGLRQIVGAEDVADAAGVPLDPALCCFHGGWHPFDVSDDGGRLVFGAIAGDGEHVLVAQGDGSDVRLVRASAMSVMRVAISGNGDTIAWNVLPPGASADEVASLPFAGGESMVHAVPPSGAFDDPLQLNADGSRLLVSPNGLLIDTATGEARLLATAINGVGGNHEAVLTDGLARATMDAAAGRFLYAMRTVRCADCVNLPEQLAILDLNPADRGEAPAITDATIEPAEIGLNRISAVIVTAAVDSPDTIQGVGLTALLDGGVVDPNVGHLQNLVDDGQGGDATAADGVYTATIVHAPVVARNSDTGARTLRVAVEVADRDGLRHATAVDVGTLTVVAP